MPSPDIIRLALVALAFLLVLCALFRPFFAVIGYLIIMVTRPGLHYPALASIRIELVIGVFVMVAMFFLPGKLARLHPKNDDILKYMYVLFGVMLLSMLQAFDFSYSFDWMQDFGKVFLFFLMIVALADNEKDVQIFMMVFAILMAYLAYDAIYNFHTGRIIENIGGDRVDYATASEGMGSGHVALANLILQGMPILWYLSWQNRSRLLKYCGIFLFFLSLYGVIISGSRGGFVGIIVLYICMLYFSRHRMYMVIGGLLGVFLMPFLVSGSYFNYMETILDMFSGTSDVSGGSRVSGLQHGFEMLIRRPFLGVGPGCYPLARSAWFGWGLWAHNHYGELMGDLGIIGTWVWFLFFKSYFVRAWRFMKDLNGDPDLMNVCMAVVVATIVRLVSGMGSHSVYIFFWYMMAGITVVSFRSTTKFKAPETRSPVPSKSYSE